jgi:hypothetical protein
MGYTVGRWTGKEEHMSTIVQITTTVRPDGSIEVHAPGLTPGQQVTVSIDVTPQAAQLHTVLDQLYGALADSPMPEMTSDPFPEARDDL